jgi:hypothetical protein
MAKDTDPANTLLRFVQVTLHVAGGLRGPRYLTSHVCQWCGALIGDPDRHATVDCRKFKP